jgi:hypothetical protein
MNSPARYRKKPVVVEAILLSGDNRDVVVDWIGGGVFFRGDDGIVIQTLEGDMHAQVGDYIIKGVHGEFYPCKADIFDATYECVGGES